MNLLARFEDKNDTDCISISYNQYKDVKLELKKGFCAGEAYCDCLNNLFKPKKDERHGQCGNCEFIDDLLCFPSKVQEQIGCDSAKEKRCVCSDFNPKCDCCVREYDGCQNRKDKGVGK